MPAITPKPVGGGGGPSAGITLGSADFQEQGSNFVLDPQYGDKSTLNVEGSLERLLPQGALYKLRGFRVSITQIADSPQWKMTVLLPDLNDGNEFPTTRWKIDGQIEDVDIFNLPDAADEMSFYSPPSLYRKLLVNAVKNGEEYPAADIDPSLFPFASQIYRWLCEGVKAWPVLRPTLTRIRTMSWDFASPFVIPTYPDVYTTAALVDNYQIPPLIAAKLPAGNGDLTPPNREWGWLMQHSDADTLMGQVFKQEESVTWVFAPWELALYNFIG